MKVVRRGYLPEYEDYFKGNGLNILKEASKDVLFLLNRGYKVKVATMFVQQHYQLSEPQRLALARTLATRNDIELRNLKKLDKEDCKDKEVYIDGFNAIIPMESLLSESPIFECMDDAIRDMANLRVSYHIIDKTSNAIHLLLKKLDELKVKKANIYLDKPISNSGRLKTLIAEIGEQYNVELNIELLNAVDKELYGKENVISGDCIVLNECKSWIPLYKWIIDSYEKEHKVWKVKIFN